MNAKSIKLLRKFVNYSGGTPQDLDLAKKEFKGLNWKEKTKHTKRMKELLGNTRNSLIDAT